MSRAFVKEDAPDTLPLPDLPVSAAPNHVTRRGLVALQQRLAGLQADLLALKARPDRLDLMPEKVAERDIRYLNARIASAILSEPQQFTTVGFGHAVSVADADGRQMVYEIVGEDEADAALGRIAPRSPLAQALIGAQVGDTVEWQRPNGPVALTITGIGMVPG